MSTRKQQVQYVELPIKSNGNNEVQEINLYDLSRYYVSKWLIILVITTLAITAGFTYNYLQKPMYKSTSTMVVVGKNDSTSNQYTTLVNNYLTLFKSRRVLDQVITDANVSLSYDDLAKHTTVTNDKNTEIIKTSITSSDPFSAQDMLDDAIKSFKTEATKIYGTDNIKIIDDASFEIEPYNANSLIILLISASAGLLSSLIALFFAYDIRQNSSKSKNNIIKPQTRYTVENTIRLIVNYIKNLSAKLHKFTINKISKLKAKGLSSTKTIKVTKSTKTRSTKNSIKTSKKNK